MLTHPLPHSLFFVVACRRKAAKKFWRHRIPSHTRSRAASRVRVVRGVRVVRVTLTLNLKLFDGSSDTDIFVRSDNCSKDVAAKFDAIKTSCIHVELRDIMCNVKSGVTTLSVADGNIRILPTSFDFDAHVAAITADAT